SHTGNDWTGTGGTTSDLTGYGLGTKKLLAANNGYVKFLKGPNSPSFIVALDDDNTTTTSAGYKQGVRFVAGDLQTIDNGVTSSSNTLVDGTWLMIDVNGSVVTLKMSTDNDVTYSTVYTFTPTRTTDSYLKINISLNSVIHELKIY